MTIRLGQEVESELRAGGAVVALESTIFSTLGLPEPHNAEALRRVTAAIRDRAAVPALTAVLDGQAVIGCTASEAERVLTATQKVAGRDLSWALASRARAGVTTVSAALTLASAAGIDVFATGGIGGVHRDVEASGDVSADLDELARHSVVTVCAGAKAFLDLPRTLERLETLGVAVLGWGTSEFPAFWSRQSGQTLAHRVDAPHEVVAVLRAQRELARPHGVLVAAPVPEQDELPRSELDPVIEAARARALATGAAGPSVTPAILAAIARATGGRAVATNLALAEHNAGIAAGIAAAIAVERGA